MCFEPPALSSFIASATFRIGISAALRQGARLWPGERRGGPRREGWEGGVGGKRGRKGPPAGPGHDRDARVSLDRARAVEEILLPRVRKGGLRDGYGGLGLGQPPAVERDRPRFLG